MRSKNRGLNPSGNLTGSLWRSGAATFHHGFIGDLALWALGAIMRATLLLLGNTGCIESTPDDMVAYPREVSDPSTSDKDDGVLLQVVTLSWYVGGDLPTIC